MIGQQWLMAALHIHHINRQVLWATMKQQAVTSTAEPVTISNKHSVTDAQHSYKMKLLLSLH